MTGSFACPKPCSPIISLAKCQDHHKQSCSISLSTHLLPLLFAGECLPGCGHRARVITGVGDGKNFNALKERLEKLMKEGDLVEKLEYQDDNGAIVVTLTRYNDDKENPLNMYGNI